MSGLLALEDGVVPHTNQHLLSTCNTRKYVKLVNLDEEMARNGQGIGDMGLHHEIIIIIMLDWILSHNVVTRSKSLENISVCIVDNNKKCRNIL